MIVISYVPYWPEFLLLLSQLAHHDKEVQASDLRSEHVMNKEAEELRPYFVWSEVTAHALLAWWNTVEVHVCVKYLSYNYVNTKCQGLGFKNKVNSSNMRTCFII